MTAPVNNPAGGARSTSPVTVGFVGWDTSYVQSGMGKGTLFIGADRVPVSMGGQPLVVGEPTYAFDGPGGSYNLHYGDYISGPLAYWIDASGYWADSPAGGGYAWYTVMDWGDGSPLENVGSLSFSVQGTHVYSANGTYTIRLWSYIFRPGDPNPNPWGSGWTSHIPTDYNDASLWWDITLIETFEVVANDGQTYHGFTGPKSRLGVSVVELMEIGRDDTYHPFAALLTVPFSQVRTGTDSGDSPDTGLSPPIAIGDPDSYWPGELVDPIGVSGADIGGNNDLAGEFSIPPQLPPVDVFSQVRIRPSNGTRSGYIAGDYFREPELLGVDGTGMVLYTGNDPLPTPVHFYDDVWGKFWLGRLEADTGLDSGIRIYPDERLRLVLGSSEFSGEWNGPTGSRPRWRGVYSDDEVLLEIGDGLIFVVNIASVGALDQATEWYFLTDLSQFQLGLPTNQSLMVNETEGRGYGPKLRADGGFWLKTSHSAGSSTIVGIGRDGSLEVQWDAPSGSYATFNAHDFPDLYGANWSIYDVVGDPTDHDIAYAASSYLEPFPEYRASTVTGYNPPHLDPNNHWIDYVRRVSAVFRCEVAPADPSGYTSSADIGWDTTITPDPSGEWSGGFTVSPQLLRSQSSDSYFEVRQRTVHTVTGVRGPWVQVYANNGPFSLYSGLGWTYPHDFIGFFQGGSYGTNLVLGDVEVRYATATSASGEGALLATWHHGVAPKDVQPALWLQQPYWFSTDGLLYPEHVREPSIYISSIFWTDSIYTGGHWTGPTRITPTLTVGEPLHNVVFE